MRGCPLRLVEQLFQSIHGVKVVGGMGGGVLLERIFRIQCMTAGEWRILGLERYCHLVRTPKFPHIPTLADWHLFR